MKFIWTSIKKNKLIIFFLLTIFIIGFIFGIIYYINLPKITKTGINDNLVEIPKLIKNIHINNFILHIGIFTLIFFLSFTVVFFPLILFSIFYEGMSLGFSLIIFFSSFKISGLIYAIILFILTKIVYLLLIFYMIYNSFIICKTMILLFIKKQGHINITFKKHLKRLIVIILIMLIYDLFLFLLGNKILLLFNFLLK